MAGLAVEYCRLLENCGEMTARDFAAEVLRYLPRIYITAGDFIAGEDPDDNGAIYESLDEDTYNGVCAAAAALFGEYDTYLDTPVEEMRYSDTPVAASLSEKLGDIYQNMYDLAETLREVPESGLPMVGADLAYRFRSFLSQDICDALRTVNFLYQSDSLDA